MGNEEPAGERARANWTFVTNHARVLAAIARDPGVRLRDVAAICRLTERAVQAIVADLERDGYLTHTRSGRRNHYSVAADTLLRHPAENGLSVAVLLDVLTHAHPGQDTADTGGQGSGAGPDGAPAIRPRLHAGPDDDAMGSVPGAARNGPNR